MLRYIVEGTGWDGPYPIRRGIDKSPRHSTWAGVK